MSTPRLIFLAWLVALLFSPSLGAAELAVPPAPKDWPMGRGDGLARGVSGAALPEKLSVVWKHQVKDGAFEATAAIVDGVVYIGDLDGHLMALDLRTGKQRWQVTLDAGFIASPAVRDKMLYVGDIEGILHAYTLDGKEKWKYETGAEIDSGVNFYKENILVGSQDATLYCLQPDGKLLWQFTIDDQIRCTPTVVENRAFVAGCDGKLHVIDLDKGMAVDDVVIEAPTGTTPAVQGDMVYFGTEGATFFGIDWRKAAVVWTYRAPQRPQAYRSSASVAGDLLVVGGRNNRVNALATLDGKEVWAFATRKKVDSSPVIVGDRVFVGSSDGRLYALDLKTGKERWQYDAGAGFTGSPAVADGHLVIASEDGVIYCFGGK